MCEVYVEVKDSWGFIINDTNEFVISVYDEDLTYEDIVEYYKQFSNDCIIDYNKEEGCLTVSNGDFIEISTFFNKQEYIFFLYNDGNILEVLNSISKGKEQFLEVIHRLYGLECEQDIIAFQRIDKNWKREENGYGI